MKNYNIYVNNNKLYKTVSCYDWELAHILNTIYLEDIKGFGWIFECHAEEI